MRSVKISRRESYLAFLITPERINDGYDPISFATATGFLWERNGRWFLVTNAHALAGWDYTRNRALSGNASTPTHVSLNLWVEMPSPHTPGRLVTGAQGKRLPVEDDGEPLWLVHPVHGAAVDVAVLEMCLTPTAEDVEALGVTRIATAPVNKHDWVSFPPSAGDDALVLGYPHGMHSGGFPIWKRASVASEPDMDIDGLPKLLIDTATREGMSGSPVLVVSRGVTSPRGVFGEDSVFGESLNFLGVYSGRIGVDPMGVQLGLVWKSSVIDEIIDGGVRGAWPWN